MILTTLLRVHLHGDPTNGKPQEKRKYRCKNMPPIIAVWNINCL
jgi:hypothetical protein